MSDCNFLHARDADDWGRCPHPEQVKEYNREDGSSVWYCDEGAEELTLVTKNKKETQ